ncbi:MAG: hypothetical protein ACHP7O_07150 [Burkholderiales bacterium]
MPTIEIDFDVFKQLTLRRTNEDVSNNDVIRELLGIGPGKSVLKDRSGPSLKNRVALPQDWVAKGVSFPDGTDFKANYKGKIHTARVNDGAIYVNGKPYHSPSAAAMAITGSPINGWSFWECRFPGKVHWEPIESLRVKHEKEQEKLRNKI